MKLARRRMFPTMPAGGGLFSPSQIAGLNLWLKADNGIYQDAALTTLATANNHQIGGWKDLSGNGRHATNSGTGRPILKYGVLNGRPVLRWDGINDKLVTASGIQLPMTLFVVTATMINQASLIIGGSTANQPALYVDVVSTVWKWIAVHSAIGTYLQTPVTDTNFHIHRVVYADSGSYSIDSISKATGDLSTGNTPTFFNIGARTDLGLPYNGDIAEILIYSGSLAVKDITSVEAYLTKKYLPSGGSSQLPQWLNESIPVIGAVDVMSDGTVISASANIIKSSDDGGDNWNNVGSLPAGILNIGRIFVDNHNYIFASGLTSSAGDAGLYRSVDRGVNFTKVLTMSVDTGVWGIDEDTSGNLYAGEYSRNSAGAMKIWKSTDGGANWVLKYSNSDAGYDEHHIHDLRVNPSNGYIYATTGDKLPSGTNILLRSKDAGETWTVIYTGVQFVPITFLESYVYVGSDDVGTQKIYRFTDSGNETVTLEEIYESPTGHNSYFYVAAESSTEILFGQADTTLGGIHDLLVFNGVGWATIVTAPGNTWGFSQISRHNRNGYFYIGGDPAYRVAKIA